MKAFLQILLLALFVAHASAAESPRKYFVNDYAKSPLIDEEELLKAEEQENSEEVKAEEPEKAPEAPENIATKLSKEYGDPGTDPAINVVDNAPKPFKAMMAAFEAGDNDLAFQYARQYVRYLNRLNQRTTKVMGATRYAMAREGMLNGEKFPDDPKYREFRELYEKDIANQEATSSQVEIPDAARALIEKAAVMEGGKGNVPPRLAQSKSPIKESLPQNVPVDPQGRVDVHLFVKLRQAESQKMLATIINAAAALKSDSRVKFVVHALDPLSIKQADQLAAQLGTGISLRQGSPELVKMLGVKQTPTLAIVSPSTSQALLEEGERTDSFIKSIVLMMQGKGKR